MKTYRLLLAVLILLLIIPVLQPGTPAAVQAAEDPVYALTGDEIILKTSYNLRLSANDSDRSSINVPSGTRLLVEEQYTAAVTHLGGNAVWYRVTYQGTGGWIFADPGYQTIQRSQLPAYASAGDRVQVFTGIGYTVRTAVDVNKKGTDYIGPGDSFKVEETITASGNNPAGNKIWYRFTLNGRTGYIWADSSDQYIIQSYAAHPDKSQAVINAENQLAAARADLTVARQAMEAQQAQLADKTRYEQAKSWLDQLNAGGNPIPLKTTHYYNFYNIGSYPDNSRVDGAKLNGLNFAMGNTGADQSKYLLPWNTRERAMNGGALYIRTDYIDRNQNSPYLMKFNVVDTVYRHPESHQYMQAVMAPESEARNIHKAYQNAGILDQAIRFEIPVYPGMPAQAALNPRTGTRVDTSKPDLSGVDEAFVKQLQAFPESYWRGLLDLHNKYPAWIFVPVSTSDTWEHWVLLQTYPENRNLIEDNAANQKLVRNHTGYDGSYWVPVTRQGIEYYMDPRNFLQEQTVFMFEDLSVQSEAQSLNREKTIGGINAIAGSNSALRELSSLIYDAAQYADTSAFMLASRIQLEITVWRNGKSDISNLARGTLDKDYPPYFSDQDSLSYMSRSEQIATLTAVVNSYESARVYVEAYERAQIVHTTALKNYYLALQAG